MFNVLYDKIVNGIPQQNLSKKLVSRLYVDLKNANLDFQCIDVDAYQDNNLVTVYPLELDFVTPLEVFDLFNKKSLEIIIKNNISILIWWPTEGFGISKNNYWLEFLQYSLGKLGLEHNKKFLVSANLKIEEEYRAFRLTEEQKHDLYNEKLREIALSKDFDLYRSKGKIEKCFGIIISHPLYREYFLKEKQNTKWQKYKINDHGLKNIVYNFDDVFMHWNKKVDFLCYNRLLKPHRMALITELFRNDLDKHGYISCIEPIEKIKNRDYFKDQTKDFLYNESCDFFDKFIVNFQPMHLSYGDISLCSDTFSPYQIHADHFIESWYSLVVETEYDNDTLAIGEKTLKPIANGHPFIVWGNPGILEYLRSQGYQTFPELFDESYDLEHNHQKRLSMIIDQVKNFSYLSKKHKKKKLESVKQKIFYNRQLFLRSDTESIKNIFDHLT